jgi:uncharacterized protein (DUF4415 family)
MSASYSKRTSGTGRSHKVSKHGTDFARLEAMTDEDIRQQIADNPEVAPLLSEEWWAKGELVIPGKKRPISIRFDPEVLDYFMAGGPGYQSRMNEVLLRYVRLQRQNEIVAAMVKQLHQAAAGQTEAGQTKGTKTIDLLDALKASLANSARTAERTVKGRVGPRHREPEKVKKSAR